MATTGVGVEKAPVGGSLAAGAGRAVAEAATSAGLSRRALVLEGLTFGWNTIEAAVALVAGGRCGFHRPGRLRSRLARRDLRRLGVIWQLRGVPEGSSGPCG